MFYGLLMHEKSMIIHNIFSNGNVIQFTFIDAFYVFRVTHPVVGMGNWEIRIEGLHRKFKVSYPTQLVLFKVQNDLVAKNISDQNFTIDGKQFKIREYLETTSFRCTRCQELGSHLSKDCSNPKKCVRCAGPDCEIRNCKKGTLSCSNCGGGHSAAHKSCPALKAKNQNLFLQKQQKISR